MGLLDDAIREHLDLKRRRGADPAEVERAEREALGPVRRNPNPADPADLPAAAEDSGQESGFAYDQAAEAGWSQDSLHEPVSGAAEATYDEPAPAEPAYEEPAYAEPGLGEPAYEEPAAAPPPDDEPDAATAPRPRDLPEDDEDEPEPFPTAPPSSRPLTDVGGGETQEYRVEDYLTAEPEQEPAPAGDEDVLEETPDFLHDTPDHDRLWFEQRPPKDFDFDE